MVKLTLEKVLVADPVDAVATELLKRKNVLVHVNTGLSEAQLIQVIPEYDGLIVRSSTQVTASIIKAGHRLKVIGRAGVGVDNIDVDAATAQGILVVNSPSGNTLAAAELTCGLIVALSRHIAQACLSLKNGVWDRKTFVGTELSGKILAIIGLGRIGREVATRMKAFGMKTIGYDPIIGSSDASKFGIDWMTLEEIWPIADYITVHVPLLPETKYLLNEVSLNKCKKGVRLINVARGGIIDESALFTCIQSGQVAGAALDVYEEEPPKNSTLLQNSKILCTPHLGASTKEAQSRVATEVVEQFINLLIGFEENELASQLHGLVNRSVLQDKK